MKRGYNKITAVQARDICDHLVENIRTHQEIAEYLGVAKHTVADIAALRRWKEVLKDYNPTKLRRKCLWRLGTK